ncbi:hypothetical protein ABV409_01240 [Flagellimonas sp. DF-77]|uniref:hypothetical protein n=1 Tax=Flagellimonas algarum TaxID=3230298 RepID=UPI003395F613
MSDYCETERKRIHRWANFQIAHSYKRLGLWAALCIVLLMIGKKFIDAPVWVKPVLTSTLIIALLVVSLAKERIEDEFINSIRALSYRWAFVMGVLYALIQPYINYAVDWALGEANPELDQGFFPVLIFMLLVQLASFHQLKRLG